MNPLLVKILGIAAIAITLSVTAPPPATPNTGGTETRYEVIAKGFRIGNVSVYQRSSRTPNETVIHFENLSDINASFIWMGYHLSMSERGTISKNDLVSYSRYSRENGNDVSIEGRLDHAVFLFHVLRNGKRSTVEIPRASYEHTTMECPEATMEFGATGEVTLKVLDTDFVTVVKRRYRLVREDTYKVGAREYRCRVVDISDPNKSCRRWIGRDGNTVIIFRQDGKGKDGSYSVRAVAVDTHQQPAD